MANSRSQTQLSQPQVGPFLLSFIILLFILAVMACLAVLGYMFRRQHRDRIQEAEKKEAFLNAVPGGSSGSSKK